MIYAGRHSVNSAETIMTPAVGYGINRIRMYGLVTSLVPAGRDMRASLAQPATEVSILSGLATMDRGALR